MEYVSKQFLSSTDDTLLSFIQYIQYVIQYGSVSEVATHPKCSQSPLAICKTIVVPGVQLH